MKSEQDKVQDLKFLDGIVSLYYNSRPDLQIIFYKERNYNNKYSINNNVTSNFDFRDFEWYQQFAESSIDKSIIVNNTDEDGKAFVHSIIYRIRDVYGENTVGYLSLIHIQGNRLSNIGNAPFAINGNETDANFVVNDRNTSGRGWVLSLIHIQMCIRDSKGGYHAFEINSPKSTLACEARDNFRQAYQYAVKTYFAPQKEGVNK